MNDDESISTQGCMKSSQRYGSQKHMVQKKKEEEEEEEEEEEKFLFFGS